MTKVFIDGSAGTTGLRIFERLEARNDIQLLTLSEENRKDVNARKQMLNSCDVAFLCLPDDAARESVSLIDNPDVIVLDTSTAHRTAEGWAYGFPELSPKHYQNVKNGKRIAVPGCHASGFISLVYPLIKEGILSKDVLLACTSVTGYSGGGKKMIAEYEGDTRCDLLGAPRQYGLAQTHKHLKEMKHVAEINNEPAFSPIVADFYSGMCVTIPLFLSQLNGKTAEDIKNVYKKYYSGGIVYFNENADESGFISASKLAGKDNMEISVFGNDQRLLLMSRYDNLGKGASGAAIECMNIALNIDKENGLIL